MSLARQADKYVRKTLEACDPYSGIRNALKTMAEERGDYSGCPIPIDGQRLVIEPTYKYRVDQCLTEEERKEEGEERGFKIRNIFWSIRRRCRYAICEDPDGTIWAAPLLGSSTGATALLKTIGASDVWGIEQEHNAVQLLGTLVRHRQLRQYLLSGAFLETSERSKITYVFRKLKPTVAISTSGNVSNVLCTLCMHPIGYYEESNAGCMTPTDDVIAHLTMMRGDEKMFWRRSNQHMAYDPASGL